MEKGYQLSEEITNKLLEEIRNGMFSKEDKLPPEVEVAETLGVSRNMIRECFVKLEQRGYISRKHGVGTIINHHVLEVDNRMELGKDFTKMIEEVGKYPKVLSVDIALIEAGEVMADKLKIENGDSVFEISRLIAADDLPVVYCIDYIAKNLIKDNSYNSSEMKESIYYFLEKYCKTDVHMSMSEVCAVEADEKMAELFDINKGYPMLYMNDVEYNFRGDVVLYSEQYYANGILKHMVLRKKI